MTLSILHIVVSIVLIVAGATMGTYFFATKKRKQPPTDRQNELDSIKKSIHQLELKNEKLELQATEMKEFVTRSMNRISARSSKLDKNQETWEQMQALLEQSKEIDSNGPAPANNQPSTMGPRRLVRVSKGDV